MKTIDTFFMSEKQIEQMKRKRKWNKKMTVAVTFSLLGLASAIAISSLPQSLGIDIPQLSEGFIPIALKGVASFGTIIGTCTFAKALHDPLTEKEAKELAERDAIEKGGRSK